MPLNADRRLPHDWFDGVIPVSVDIDDEAYVESAYSFIECQNLSPHAIRIGRGAHVYSSSIFDVGPTGQVLIGTCAMLNGARIVCDQRIEIGAFATISWNVMFMDSYRVPIAPEPRRGCIERAARTPAWVVHEDVGGRPIVLRDNVWIGFDACVLPGVTIGEGSIVGARSVVSSDVPEYTVVAGNPARVIRELPRNVRVDEELRLL